MMKKRKGSPTSISQDVKSQTTLDAGIAADFMDLNVVSLENSITSKHKKDLSVLAEISHKNISGANNWKTFLNLNKQQSKGLNKPNVKQRNQPFNQSNELSLADPLDLTKGKSVGVKKRYFKNNTRTNGIDKLVINDNAVKSIPKLTGGRQIDTKKLVLTKQIALDCEMVGVEVGVNHSMLARISLVNAHGDCIYDKYVKPTEPILDYRTEFSGIRPKDLENASDFKTVQQEVADMIKGRILVGHALHNDLGVLFLKHPRFFRRDTSTFKKFKVGPIPSLKSLAKQYLGVTIQDGEHNSKQDALAAMQLYNMFKKEWEDSFHKTLSKNQKAKSAKKSAPSKSATKIVSSAPTTNSLMDV